MRVLVADDHDIVCAGLERMIAAEPDMEVCGVAQTADETIEKARSLSPDVAILDVNMSGVTGLDITRQLRRELPGCEVLLFTGSETDDLIRQAFLAGASSFILKSDAKAHLLDAIRALARHKPYFTGKVSEIVFAPVLQRGGHAGNQGETAGRLTAHELDLIRRLALGNSNREIALELGVNLRTAEGHRAALMKKMNFESLADLVRYAVRNGVVEN